MDSREREIIRAGHALVAGIDEAGRGPLAGPVVSAAVVLFAPNSPNSAKSVSSSPSPVLDISGIKDSKLLTAARREELASYIFQNAVGVGLGIAWPEEIDEINILQATLRSMERAASSIKDSTGKKLSPNYLMIDGRNTIKLPIPMEAIIKGDQSSASIAAASIIAKTTRDRIMASYHSLYPHYGFIKNQGYGTRVHMEALRTEGPSPIHRRSFRWPGNRGKNAKR